MNEQDCHKMAQWFLILSHPIRLQILGELIEADRCVCDLQAALCKPQPYVSQQLRVLHRWGMVERHRVAQFHFYRLADPLVKRVLSLALGQIDSKSHD